MTIGGSHIILNLSMVALRKYVCILYCSVYSYFCQVCSICCCEICIQTVYSTNYYYINGNYHIFSLSTVVVQCTITPLNPTTLTATGGTLVSGTTDVRIQCICTGSSGNARWYDINTNFLVQSTHSNYVAGSPYFIPNNPNGRTDVTLVIPTFTDSYDGTYNCGIRVNDTSFTSPSAAVTLTIW